MAQNSYYSTNPMTAPQQQQYFPAQAYNTAYGQNQPYKQPNISVAAADPSTSPYQPPAQSYNAPPAQNYNAPSAQQSFRQHLASLPMFPLYTHHEEEARQNALHQSAQLLGQQQPEPQLNMAEKATLGFMDATTGGLMNVRKLENNLLKVAAGSVAMTAKEAFTLVLTRWAVIANNAGASGNSPTIMVDVLEARGMMKSNAVNLKTNAESVKLSLLGKTGVKVKGSKTWTKNWNTKPVDSLAVVYEKGGAEVPMEVVATVQRGISPAAYAELLKRFEHGWHVPRV
ncbi:hypothetical protein H2198_005917 [Neophaeococcomyces mojaviensis]|uniref:Uncharacterized protein n=1 Tax=Neophaeococcomyces mojaviensis TaxID=3383035 RepID=A0ACC3A4B2_9EURO|nr:hypothetical protein H2198_005917 [Knufia sp. JES_112]